MQIATDLVRGVGAGCPRLAAKGRDEAGNRQAMCHGGDLSCRGRRAFHTSRPWPQEGHLGHSTVPASDVATDGCSVSDGAGGGASADRSS